MRFCSYICLSSLSNASRSYFWPHLCSRIWELFQSPGAKYVPLKVLISCQVTPQHVLCNICSMMETRHMVRKELLHLLARYQSGLLRHILKLKYEHSVQNYTDYDKRFPGIHLWFFLLFKILFSKLDIPELFWYVSEIYQKVVKNIKSKCIQNIYIFFFPKKTHITYSYASCHISNREVIAYFSFHHYHHIWHINWKILLRVYK